jgi:hypothetical protein
MITSTQEAKYCLAGKFKLQGDVLCLRATDDGKLASGGDCLLNNLELAAELICKRDQRYQNLEHEVENKIPVSRWSGSKRSNDRVNLDPS